MRVTQRACVLLIAASFVCAANAHAAEWKRYTFPQDRFSVEFSGPVTTEPMLLANSDDPSIERATHYAYGNQEVAYEVVAILFKGPADFDAHMKEAMAIYSCPRLDSDVTKTVAGTMRREIRATGCEGGYDLGVHFYQSGKWFHYTAYYSEARFDKAQGEYFLQSFRLEQ